MGVFIGLGSNVGDGPALIRRALGCLDQDEETHVLRVSSLYRTQPWGRTSQAEFTNAVAELETARDPAELLQALLECEAALGRTRNGLRWGPRCIDLDLLCFDDTLVSTPSLTVPHPRMHERAFVLVPLLELEPQIEIPGLGLARDWLGRVGTEGVRRLEA